MKIIKERDLILDVANAWKEQYGSFNTHIYKSLLALDLNTAAAEDVEAIIGNKSWTSIRCNECDNYTDFAIQVGEEPDYESRTACLCKSCFNKAINLFNSI